MSAIAQLNGRVDSVVPTTVLWTKVSGPGTTVFAPSATIEDPTVTLSAAGTYVLRLTATTDNSEFTNSDEVTIVAQANTAPVVNAGADFAAISTIQFALNGSVTDDGLPDGSTLTATWSIFSGTPANVSITDTSAAVTTATITGAGTYVLRLTGSDGTLSAHDDVQITVSAQPGTHYCKATPIATPGAVSLTEVEWRVELSRMADAWWTAVAANGKDIRVTIGGAANTPVPFDLIHFADAGTTGTGTLVFKASSSPGECRIWLGLPSAIALPADDTYGQYNAYHTSNIGFWPDGSGNDRTRHLHHLTSVGSPVVATNAILGASTTTYGTNKYAYAHLDAQYTLPITLTGSYSTTLSGSQQSEIVGIGKTNNLTLDSGHDRVLLEGILSGGNQTVKATTDGNSFSSAATVSAGSATFKHFGGRFPADKTRYAVSSTTSSHETTQSGVDPMDYVVLGAKARLIPAQFGTAVNSTLITAYNADMGDAYVEYQGQQLDQDTFWALSGSKWVYV